MVRTHGNLYVLATCPGIRELHGTNEVMKLDWWWGVGWGVGWGNMERGPLGVGVDGRMNIFRADWREEGRAGRPEELPTVRR